MSGNLPKWISQSIKRITTDHKLTQKPHVVYGRVTEKDRVLGWSSFAARAIALRQLLLPKYEHGNPNAPKWLRQFAAVAVGGIPTRAPMLSAEVSVSPAEPLLPGTLLVATTKRRGQLHGEHCEAMIVKQLCQHDDANSLPAAAEHAPLSLYSYFCPCIDCAGVIAEFAAERPHLRIELAYDRTWIPEECADSHGGGHCDLSSVAAMREAGVQVETVQRLFEEAEGAEASHVELYRGEANAPHFRDISMVQERESAGREATTDSLIHTRRTHIARIPR